jgi:hypothetical protein
MKVLVSYILIIFGSFSLSSCSLSFGGLVALDNSINKGTKKISSEKISTVKMGSRVTINMVDSTSISGTLNSYSEDKKSKSLTIEDDNNKLHNIRFNDISNITYIYKSGNVWTAIAIGAVIDAIMFYVISNSKHSVITGRIL